MGIKPETMAMTSVQGRVLTRHAAQRDGQLVLQYYLATAKGPVLVEVLHGEYLCFCQQTDVAMLQLQMPGQALRYVPLALKSFSGSLISGIYTPSSQAYRTLVRIAKDAGIALFEADIRPEQRFLIERFVALDVAFLGHFAKDSQSTAPAAACDNISFESRADAANVTIACATKACSDDPAASPTDCVPSLPRFIAKQAKSISRQSGVPLRAISLDVECSL
ncbi:MAG: hypothetical protein ACRDA8_11060, partial [Shewanella sp.]